MLLDRSKLNSIENTISKALKGNEITHVDYLFTIIVNEDENIVN